MKHPITLIHRMDRQLARDAGFLFIASCFVMVSLFGYPLQQAALLSPLVVLAVMLGLYLLIQIAWITMVVVDRVLMTLGIGGHDNT